MAKKKAAPRQTVPSPSEVQRRFSEALDRRIRGPDGKIDLNRDAPMVPKTIYELDLVPRG